MCMGVVCRVLCVCVESVCGVCAECVCVCCVLWCIVVCVVQMIKNTPCLSRVVPTCS